MSSPLASMIRQSLSRLECLLRGLDETPGRRHLERELGNLGSTLELFLAPESALEERNQRLLHLSRYDEVTKLYNELNFLERLDEEFQRALRYASPLSLMIVEVDDLESLNEARGHLVGNELLRRIARAIRQNIRENDVAGRYDGDEFAILLPQTSSDQAEWLGQRIRDAVAALPDNVTVTVGTAFLGEPTTLGPLELLAHAHRALDRAKAWARTVP